MGKLFYVAEVFGTIETISTILLLAVICLILILTISHRKYLDDGFDEEAGEIKKTLTKLWTAVVASSLIIIFIPSEKTFLLMKGGGAVEQAVTSKPEIRELQGNTLELLNEYIKTATENLKEKKEQTVLP